MGRTGYDWRMTLFDADPILPPDPEGLEVLHEREYRIRAYRLEPADDRGERLLLRGAVRDQKPAHLYIAEDPDPITIHHMQVELEIAFPSMLILESSVLFEAHPHETCVSIIDAYRGLVGLSVARGFTHKVRELFGGPRGCTHTTALLMAMAPVAIQCIWSMQAAEARRTREPMRRGGDLSPDEREQRWAASLNSCHVWDNDGDLVRELRNGVDIGLPIPMRKRFAKLGIEPGSTGV